MNWILCRVIKLLLEEITSLKKVNSYRYDEIQSLNNELDDLKAELIIYKMKEEIEQKPL